MTLTIPTVEDCFLPVLRVLATGGKPVNEESALKAAKREGFNSLPSILHVQTDKRGVPLIQRRIAWAKFYLNAAGFLKHRSRSLIQITEDGLSAVESNRCTWALLSSSQSWAQKFGPGWLPPQAQV